MILPPENDERFEIYLDAVLGFITDVTADERAALRAELHEHLMALYLKFRPECIFDEDAVEMAIRKFGPAWRVGPALNRMTPAGQVRARSRRSALKAQWISAITHGVSGVLPFLSIAWLNLHNPDTAFYAGMAFIGALAAFAEAWNPSSKSIRWDVNFFLKTVIVFECLGVGWIALSALRPILLGFTLMGMAYYCVASLTSRLRRNRILATD